MEVGRTLGIYKAYRWAYTLRTMQEAILFGALIAGTYWYPSMWDRRELKGEGVKASGICTLPSATEQPAGGHLFCLNGYNAARGLWRSPSTWDDGDYLITDELMFRLLREEGEIAQPDEIKLTYLR